VRCDTRTLCAGARRILIAAAMGAQGPDNLRDLRHELRTPINHILGL